jgi:response regulator RpfG family c-di-GMP phosphodiesterase
MNQNILCIDDDPVALLGFRRDLKGRFTVVTAPSGEEGLKVLTEQGPFGVLVADMMMPGMNGVEVLAQAQNLAPDTVRIMLTGDEDKRTAIEAINEGRIFRFLTKPCAQDRLIATIEAGARLYQLVTAERELLEKTLNGSVKMLTELLAAGDPKAFGRGERLRDYVRTAAPFLKLSETWDVEMAAMLAQIGQVTIPPTILQKVQGGFSLNEAERTVLARVPEIGFKLLSSIPRLEPAAQIVFFQNKNFDGSGFPNNSTHGEQIPKGARILRVLSDLLNLEEKGFTKESGLLEMRKSWQFYDNWVLDGVTEAFKKVQAPSIGRAVSLKELRVGQELTSAVETRDGRLIAGPGTKISQTVLERFQNFAELSGIKEPINVKD